MSPEGQRLTGLREEGQRESDKGNVPRLGSSALRNLLSDKLRMTFRVKEKESVLRRLSTHGKEENWNNDLRRMTPAYSKYMRLESYQCS